MQKEAILTQLGYGVSENSLAQLQRVIDNTRNFEYIEKHLISLNETLKAHFSFIALSSSKDYFKIKNEAPSQELRDEVDEIIKKWATKYKIEIQKVDGKDTYYIIGKEE